MYIDTVGAGGVTIGCSCVTTGLQGVLILGSKTLRKQIYINVMEGSRAKASCHGELIDSENGLAAVPDSGSTATFGLQAVTVSLGAIQTISHAEKGPNVIEDNFIEELLAWEPGMVIEGKLEWEKQEQTREEASLEGGTGRNAAGAWACFADQGVGRPDRCFSLRSDGEFAGLGSADAAEMDAAYSAPQGQAEARPRPRRARCSRRSVSGCRSRRKKCSGRSWHTATRRCCFAWWRIITPSTAAGDSAGGIRRTTRVARNRASQAEDWTKSAGLSGKLPRRRWKMRYCWRVPSLSGRVSAPGCA